MEQTVAIAGYSGMAAKYLDHKLECPFCGTIRLMIPADAIPTTPITCAECGKYLGTWDELQTDFERQGGTDGVFRLNKGRIKKLD
ncbi:hypothetical protein [Mesorhizobium sp.]|uniref:hypothetical protein n=1 Tax=Mesorhizobium sp. TaxID=1871066 RepID=UPI0025B942E5|nr:hypothetical protein [Mesorhizobium sp.]